MYKYRRSLAIVYHNTRSTQALIRCYSNKRDKKTSIDNTKSNEKDTTFDMTHSFDALNSTSVETMGKILDIIKDVENQNQKIKHTRQKPSPTKEYYHPLTGKEQNEHDRHLKQYQNYFSTKLGHEIFMYNVVKFLNEKEIVGRNSNLWEDDPNRIVSLYQAYIQKFKVALQNYDESFFKQDSITLNQNLNMYQSMTKYFNENNAICHNMMKRDLRRLSKTLLTHEFSNFANKVEYNLPELKINNLNERTSDPLMLKNSFPTHEHRLNSLPFIFNDMSVIKKFLKNVHPNLIKTLMLTQSMEGSLIFKIMIKKKLQLINELDKRDLIIDFITNDNENPDESDIDIVKSLIALKSGIPYRLILSKDHSNDYKRSLRYMDLNFNNNNVLIENLADQFDKYIGILYRINPKFVDTWATELIDYYIENVENDTIPKLLNNAIDEMRIKINAIEFESYPQGTSDKVVKVDKLFSDIKKLKRSMKSFSPESE